MKKWLLLLIVMLTGLLPLSPQARMITGFVVGVHDGDTITILDYQKQQTKVRLGEIDAPESTQPYGSRAKQELSDLVFKKIVNVEVEKIDKYGRTVGRVYAENMDINAEMVRRGAVWIYRQYAKDRHLYDLEQYAKSQKAGLWSLPESERIPPWEWRHNGKAAAPVKESAPSIAAASVGAGLTCAEKTTCKQMVSCAEAKFYLTQCGLSRLDRDKDGFPCENMCQ